MFWAVGLLYDNGDDDGDDKKKVGMALYFLKQKHIANVGIVEIQQISSGEGTCS